VEIASHAAGAPFPWRGSIVAVDVIRSTTTAITAVERGRRCFVAGTVDDARRIAAGLPRPLLAGELRGRLISGFDIGNSPSAIAERTDVDRPIVLLSSSGTSLMVAAGRQSRSVLVTCLRNVTATVAHLVGQGSSVMLVGAETRGEFREEDQLCCAAIAAGLTAAGFEPSAETREIVDRWRGRGPQDIAVGASARYLEASAQSEDVRFILGHIDDLDRTFMIRDAEVVGVPSEPSKALAGTDAGRWLGPAR
jgi:2-phosphosulfolactate phosphatase